MTDYTELKRLAEEQCISSDLGMFEDHQLCENILALIAENDELRNAGSQLRAFFVDATEQCCKAERERDQLRAEVAGLKTGYQAYERVNAELKADNEALRKYGEEFAVLAERRREEVEALRNALRPLLAHWDDLKAGESLNVDAARAAMGNGEQS